MQLKNRPPTIADVAERAGVSIATVSRVLNGTTPVQPVKAERVRLAMDEMQFVPRTAARVLASKRTNTIGLILPGINGEFWDIPMRANTIRSNPILFSRLIPGSPMKDIVTTSKRDWRHQKRSCSRD